MVGFNRETGRAIIRTERKPADGGNRLNTERYRQHITRAEEMGTVCLATALDWLERDTAAKAGKNGQTGDGPPKGSQGRVAAGNGGAVEFLESLTSAIENGVAQTNQKASELDQLEQERQQIFSSASTETEAETSGDGDSTGPGGQQAATPGIEGEPATVFLDYPVGGSEKSNAQFLLDTVNKAVKKRWDISGDMKDAVVTSLSTLMVNELRRKPQDGGPDAKILLGVCRTVALLEKQNQTDELKVTPSLHLHATQPNDQRTIKPAEIRAAIASAVIAELRKRNLVGRTDDGAGGSTIDGGGVVGDGGGDGAAAAG